MTLWSAFPPVAFTALLHIMLLASRMSLGRWPSRGGADDPKSIPVVSQLHTLAVVVMLALPIALVANCMLLISLYITTSITGRPLWAPTRILLICASAWAGLALFVLLDPARVLVWFAD